MEPLKVSVTGTGRRSRLTCNKQLRKEHSFKTTRYGIQYHEDRIRIRITVLKPMRIRNTGGVNTKMVKSLLLLVLGTF
jgi:hypothetical protein